MPEQEASSMPSFQVSETSALWWVKLCRWLWKVIAFLGTAVIFGAVASIVATWFTSSKGIIPADSPLRELINTWPTTLPIGLCFLLLAVLIWMISQWNILTREVHLSTTQNRERVLQSLCYEYKKMLAESLQGAVQMELGLASRPTAVLNAASLFLRLPDQPEQLLPPHTSIIDAYKQAQQELLILGEPGAGKSTMLLNLACHLIEQAEQDVKQPLPIVLPLSSWATNRSPLQDWLSEQSALIYNVPRWLSQQWIRTDQLIFLLDGLDEMEASARTACITAINRYHREYLQSIVVCSRTNEYDTSSGHERLALHAAVLVQLLSPKQVNTYLEKIGKPLTALRSALKKNDVLAELATTPLMLQILMLTYNGISVREFSHKEAQLRQQIWNDYVKRMVSCKGDRKTYPFTLTVTWLRWLAQQMKVHNQTIFFLERLQPDWLSERKRVLYQWSVMLSKGLGIGLSVGLIFGLGIGLRDGLSAGLSAGLWVGLFAGLLGLGTLTDKIEPAEALAWSLRRELIVWLFVGLLAGLSIRLGVGLSEELLSGEPIFGLLGGSIFGLSALIGNKEPAKVLTWSLKREQIAGLIGGLIGGLFFGLFGGLLAGLFFELLGRLSVLIGNKEPAKVLTWSLRRELFFGLLGGLLAGLLGGLLFGLLGGLLFGLSFGLSGGLLFGLIGGFSGKQLTESHFSFPNEGIRRSAKNGGLLLLSVGLFFGLLGGLLAGLFFALDGGLSGGLMEGLSLGLGRVLLFGLGVGLGVGLFFGLVEELSGKLSIGLDAVIKHYILRFWLWRTHLFPWKSVPFLEDATARVLLRKVGGGYSFTHRLLLEYFADLEQKDS